MKKQDTPVWVRVWKSLFDGCGLTGRYMDYIDGYLFCTYFSFVLLTSILQE